MPAIRCLATSKVAWRCVSDRLIRLAHWRAWRQEPQLESGWRRQRVARHEQQVFDRTEWRGRRRRRNFLGDLFQIRRRRPFTRTLGGARGLGEPLLGEIEAPTAPN
jgi:hypothetical protein